MSKNDVNIGGQAVIEGVMMRSDRYIAVACRTPDGKIALKREEIQPWKNRHAIFRLPVVRGGIILIESLVHGIKALSWSADLAAGNSGGAVPQPSPSPLKSRLATVGTLALGLTLGLFLFFWLPLVLAGMTGVETGLAFNVIDGIFRLLIFGLYLGLISLWKDVRRIFEYHGAEHKSIFALENDCSLTVDGARPFSTLHPRCGTSFLLFVMILSIIVFMFLGKPETLTDRLVRLLFVPVIGGISYEFVRLSGKYRDSAWARVFIQPGLWLQKVTTGEPTDDQLEVGIIALRSARGETLNDGTIVHHDTTRVVGPGDVPVEPPSGRNVLTPSPDN